jgi:hypothetical protein
MADNQRESATGVLILDSHLQFVHCTAEAASILAYPREPRDAFSMEALPPATRDQLMNLSKATLPSSIEIASGRRRYLCRFFLLDSGGQRGAGVQPGIVVLLERVRRPDPVLQRE